MTESILLLVVPAIAVAVVLLFGFAGCDVFFPLNDPQIVFIQSAEPAASRITLSWSHTVAGAVGFEIDEVRLSDGNMRTHQAPLSPFVIRGLDPEASYELRVRALLMNGDTAAVSLPVTATTLAFRVGFETALPGDQPNVSGICFVQRLEVGQLLQSGSEVRLTIRASAAAPVSIDRVYLSQPAGGASDPYDAGADLTRVFSVDDPPLTPPIVVAANTEAVLGPFDYVLDNSQPLLIAADFSATPGSGAAVVGGVPPATGVSFFRLNTAEASIANRQAGYGSLDQITLIRRIEVG